MRMYSLTFFLLASQKQKAECNFRQIFVKSKKVKMSFCTNSGERADGRKFYGGEYYLSLYKTTTSMSYIRPH